MKCYNHNELEATGTCVECGRALCSECAALVDGKMVCKPCLARKASTVVCPPRRKDPLIAAALSLFGGMISGLLVGLGQIYNGQVKKGLALIVISWAMAGGIAGIYILASILTVGVGFLCCLPVFAVPFVFWLYTIYDAYSTAERINRGEQVRDWFD
jgi:uncharacterized membrane protein